MLKRIFVLWGQGLPRVAFQGYLEDGIKSQQSFDLSRSSPASGNLRQSVDKDSPLLILSDHNALTVTLRVLANCSKTPARAFGTSIFLLL